MFIEKLHFLYDGLYMKRRNKYKNYKHLRIRSKDFLLQCVLWSNFLHLGCRDLKSIHQCRNWKRYRYCTSNSKSMKYWCKKTCGYCTSTGTVSNCVDNRAECLSWARGGECRKNPRYMLHFCKRSCRNCWGYTLYLLYVRRSSWQQRFAKVKFLTYIAKTITK